MKKGWDENDELAGEFDPRVHSKEEYAELRDGMKSFTLKRINGKLQGAWEQHMASKNIISFDENGRWIVKDAFKFTKYSDMKSKMDYKDYEDFKGTLSLPGELEAWSARVSKFGESCRKIVGSMKLTTNL